MGDIDNEGFYAKARRLGDSEERLPCIEVALLRSIAAASSDLVKARHWPKFAAACGGVENLTAAHERTLKQYETWLADGDA